MKFQLKGDRGKISRTVHFSGEENISGEKSCPKCGHVNVALARYCGECGFFLGEITESQNSSDRRNDKAAPERPTEFNEFPEKKKLSLRCIRCGKEIEGLDKCQVCGLIVPMHPDAPDDFIPEFMRRFPDLLTKPEKFVDNQPYKLGWVSFIQPVLWTSISFIIFWVIVFLSSGQESITFFGSDLPFGSFIMISMAMIVLMFPWLLLLYSLILQLAAVIMRGRGRFERTCRSICAMLYGEFLLLGTLLALLNISKNQIDKYSDLIADSPWLDQIQIIPGMIWVILFLVQVYFLTIQIRILARVNYFEIWRSVIAHLIIALPVAVYYLLRNSGYV
ncbi:MAG: zinc ribbon domain-containing protein [bacterium]